MNPGSLTPDALPVTTRLHGTYTYLHQPLKAPFYPKELLGGKWRRLVVKLIDTYRASEELEVS